MSEQTLPASSPLPQPAAALLRMRIHYARGTELRYVGNLDMQLVWERTLRRARLPVAFSQGFNPRPRFHMAAALPLGFTSRCELLDVWLNEEMDTGELLRKVQGSAPPGLQVQEIEQVALNLPALQTLVNAAVYTALVREIPPEMDLAQAVQHLLAQPTLPRQWRQKPYDLRPLIFLLEVKTEDSLHLARTSSARMEMRLSAREGATGRPEEVLAALGLDPTAARVERTQLILENKT